MSDKESVPTLKACPFCNGLVAVQENNDLKGMFRIACRTPACKMWPSTPWFTDAARVVSLWNSRVSSNAVAQTVVIEGPSSTEYEAWLETRPDLTARFETDTFKRTTGYEIWRNAWLRLRELIEESTAAAAFPADRAAPRACVKCRHDAYNGRYCEADSDNRRFPERRVPCGCRCVFAPAPVEQEETKK